MTLLKSTNDENNLYYILRKKMLLFFFFWGNCNGKEWCVGYGLEVEEGAQVTNKDKRDVDTGKG